MHTRVLPGHFLGSDMMRFSWKWSNFTSEALKQQHVQTADFYLFIWNLGSTWLIKIRWTRVIFIYLFGISVVPGWSTCVFTCIQKGALSVFVDFISMIGGFRTNCTYTDYDHRGLGIGWCWSNKARVLTTDRVSRNLSDHFPWSSQYCSAGDLLSHRQAAENSERWSLPDSVHTCVLLQHNTMHNAMQYTVQYNTQCNTIFVGALSPVINKGLYQGWCNTVHNLMQHTMQCNTQCNAIYNAMQYTIQCNT